MTTDQITKQGGSHPILCGTDFSANAIEAADMAAAMAKKLGVKLVLVHVSEFRGLAMQDPALFEAVASQKQSQLNQEAARLRKSGAVVDERILSGSAFEELDRAANESNARLVVIGAVGHGLARRLLIGSVAERVAETSQVPTLVVRPGSTLGAWLAGDRPLKILAGYDFSDASDAAVRWLRQLRELGPCEINVTHVDWPPEAASRAGYRGPMKLDANPAQMQAFLERDLRERVGMDLPGESVPLVVAPGWGRTDAHLLQIASAQQADLVVVGTHGRHGLGRLRFGSVSRGILHDATMSVAVVPTSDGGRRKSRVPKLARVLVATDFSESGNEAIRYACAILHRGGDLKLLHVIDSNDPSAMANADNPKLLARLLSLLPEHAAERFELDPEIIATADAPEAISEAAERFNADVICLGSRGGVDPAEAFPGSVAQGVMTKSRRPVLVVREEAQ